MCRVEKKKKISFDLHPTAHILFGVYAAYLIDNRPDCPSVTPKKLPGVPSPHGRMNLETIEHGQTVLLHDMGTKETMTWSFETASWTARNNSHFGHSGDPMARFGEHRVMAAGGQNAAEAKTAEVYENGAWTVVADLPLGMYVFSIVGLSATQVLTIGGLQGGTRKCFLYDFVKNTWEAIDDFPVLIVQPNCAMVDYRSSSLFQIE